MSQRGKRGNRLENENCLPPVKRRKGRPPIVAQYENEHEVAATTIPTVSAGVQAKMGPSTASSTLWQARSITDLKLSSIYNRSSSEAPAELFRKDLISAMKLPDSEPLSADEYWVITDPWKQEWERGVQVPVNPDSLPAPSVQSLQHSIITSKNDFKLPKSKYVRITKDEQFSSELHSLSNAPTLAESACSYDLDQIDEVWLKLLNNERALCGTSPISDGQFERVIEELEVRCWDKIQAIMRSEEGLGIEYDENVICDVCRSPDSEEANEMVFCDNCNICVHQACYGITAIPSGQWLCRTCSMGKKPDCVLCPNKGGAMKSTRSGKKWAHVSCALWIPEVSIGCVDRMEPITKISSIPQSRWALICVLCRERVGACIQCSVKTCKTAYHVTCAFQHGLEMRAIIEEGNAEDGVKLRSYCLKHSVSKGKKDNKSTNNNGIGSGSDDDDCRRRKIRKDMTSEERNQVRVMRLQEVEAEFDRHVNIKDISCHLLEVDQEAIQCIYNYWILKRKSGNNRPLIPPKTDDVDMITSKQEQADIEKKKMFVHLRQDLERVRNLCYMVNRREKFSRSFFKMREQIFYKQIAVLSDHSLNDSEDSVINAVIHANNGPSVYDRFYSSASSLGDNVINFDDIQEKIKGMQKTVVVDSKAQCKNDKSRKGSKLGYTKLHVNGISDRRSDSMYDDSCLSSNSDTGKYSSSTDDQKSRKKAQSFLKSLDRHKRRKSITSSCVLDSSSEEEATVKERKLPNKKNASLQEMEKELIKDKAELSSDDDSDELMPMKNAGNRQAIKKASLAIYSDSESTDKEKTDNTVSDSQQQMFRTKAAMKEFTLQSGKSKQETRKAIVTKRKEADRAKNKGTEQSSSEKTKHKDKMITDEADIKAKRDERKPKLQTTKINEDDPLIKVSPDSKKFPTDLLVVPQRQAAKKAFENMRSTNLCVGTVGPKKDIRDSKTEEKEQERISGKEKERLREKDRMKEKDAKDEERDKDKEKTKPRGRPPKQQKDDNKEGSSKECIAKEKSHQEIKHTPNTDLAPKDEKGDKNKMDPLVAYVPQRQAAKKAAEHIKSGMGKSIAQESQEDKDKDVEKLKETEKVKDKDNKKELKKRQDKKTPAIVLSSESSESSNSSSSYSSSSSAESENEPTPSDKKKSKCSNTKDSMEISDEIKLETESSFAKDREGNYDTEVKHRASSGTKTSSGSAINLNKKPKENISKITESKIVRRSSLEKSAGTVKKSTAPLDPKPKRSKRSSVTMDLQSVTSGKWNTSTESTTERIKHFSKSEELQHETDDCTFPNKDTEDADAGTDQEKNMKDDKSYPNSSPNDEIVRTLEKEIAQRKADLVQPPPLGLKNKVNRNAGSLDKLLNKKEKERMAQEFSSNLSSINIDNSLEYQNAVTSEEKEKEEEPDKKYEEGNVNSKDSISTLENQAGEICPEVIDIDSESVESLKSKTDVPFAQKEKSEEGSNAESTQQPPSLSQEDSDKQKAAERSPPPTLSFPPINENKSFSKSFEKHHIMNFDFVDTEMTEKVEEKEDINSSSVEAEKIFSPNLSCDLNSESIFQVKQNDEDRRETMNLVEKLRQKYKRSSSTVAKHEDLPPVQLDRTEHESKVSSASFILQKDVFDCNRGDSEGLKKDDVSLISREDVSLQELPILSENEISKVENCSSEIALEEADSLVNIDKLRSNISRIQPKDLIVDFGKQDNTFMHHKSHDNVSKSSSKRVDSFDNIVSSNFLKDDFLEMHEKDNLMGSNLSSKVDCDYDENTRMQSPYTNPPNIWNENELIQTRRSVSSSPSSISESNDEFKLKTSLLTGTKSNDQQVNTQRNDLELSDKHNFSLTSFEMSPSPFQMEPQHQQPVVNGVDIMPSYNFSENNQYNGPVSLFPPQAVSNSNVQMPFPSPGAAMFPPSLGSGIPLSQATTQSNVNLFGNISKNNNNVTSNAPTNETAYSFLGQSCGAAFTSSSHNLALTAAIVSTTVGPMPVSSPQMNPFNNYNVQSQNIMNNTQNSNSNLNQIIGCESIQGTKDSPSKRTSARFTQQLKSPQMHKSPGKSPRQMELLTKQHSQVNPQKLKCETSRQRNRSTRGSNVSRVRGRGRGRGRLTSISQTPSTLEFDSTLSSIHNNLAGTVYDLDFDEDLACSSVENLKSLRDRRRSFDCRGNAQSNNDSKFTSPNHHAKLRSSASQRMLADLKSSTIVTPTDHELHCNTHSLLQNIVHPVLPGPVDMRTYSSGFENQSTTSQEAYNNHLLGAFASGTADQTLHEIDEEVEKQFQSALKASGTSKSKPLSEVIAPEIHASIETTSEEISIDSDITNTKVSLSDSRNQLKLKIKGPLAHPDNYTAAASCSAINSNLVSDQTLGLKIPSASSCNLSSMSSTSGTSSLRRMRKKELLRQYWTQDMNMEDSCLPPTGNLSNNEQTANRSVGIPKAVDSMSSIPTKDDYKDYTTIDPRKRKKMPGMSRELRQLDIKYDAERPERRRSVCSTGSNLSASNLGDNVKLSMKRRCKGKTLESNSNGDTHKLKIKIRNNVIENSIDSKRVVGCPPKKRLTNISVPTLEILKRDCMNFRKQVMADFDEEEKVKTFKTKSKKEYKESRKKKKREKKDKIQVIDNSTDTPKLIIRFGKRKAQDDIFSGVESSPQSQLKLHNSPPILGGGEEQEGNSSNKPLVPIRLKLARNSDGDGYIIGQAETEQQSLKLIDDHRSTPHIGEDHPLPSLSGDGRETETGYTDTSTSRVSPAITAATVSVVPALKVTDLKGGQTKTSKGCPLLPLNKDCEVR